jgi:hypothetical protein
LPIVPAADPPTPATDQPTYDATNVEVEPPKLLTPLANRPLPPESGRSPRALAIEIIVNETGSIESAKSATRPATLGEALQVINGLSQAMTWRFGPALSNGQHVKYRLVVPLTVF